MMVVNDNDADQTNTVNSVTGASMTGRIAANDSDADETNMVSPVTLGDAETITGMILVNDINVMQTNTSNSTARASMTGINVTRDNNTEPEQAGTANLECAANE